MDLRLLLDAEFERRRHVNRRYSLRAYARSLRTHHSTLVRFLRQDSRLAPRTVRLIGARLGLTPSEIAQVDAHENAAAVQVLVGHPGFRANSRWLAIMTGLPLDDVNLALQHLIHTGRLTMAARNVWTKQGN